jgi:exoribonuclease-2
MLPDGAVEGATLAAGRRMPAASLYLTVDESLAITGSESRLEWLTIADNLRLADLDRRMAEEAVASGRIEGAHGEDLLLLWRLARALKALRGAGDEKLDRLDYTFRVADGRVAIVPRRRERPWTRWSPSS